METNKNWILEDHLCFSLYASSRAITRMYWPMLEEMGITYPQYLVLLVLWEKQECTIKELTQILYLDPGTMTSLLKRMEEAGLITRQRADDDQRAVNIKITTAGENLREKSACIPQALLDATGMSQVELAELNRQIQKILVHI